MALPSIALPGQLLGPASKYAPGPGTHIHESNIYASLAGPVSTSSTSTTPSSTTTTSSKPTSTSTPTLSIAHAPPTHTLSPGIIGPHSGSGTNSLPTLNTPILGRITRLTPRLATLDILALNNPPISCRTSFTGLIRREDVRAYEKEKVDIHEAFRVGDVVRGEVVSIGDQGGYYVSTARNELGVVMARSVGGEEMWPVSWREFRDKEGRVERRKVAKPF
jgi:exosome complex component CSL4